jgi:hypothetical protein
VDLTDLARSVSTHGRFAAENLTVTVDHGKEVVKIMRDAARKPTYRLDALCVNNLLLQASFSRHIAVDNDDMGNAAIRAGDRTKRPRRIKRYIVTPHKVALTGEREPRHGVVKPAAQRGKVAMVSMDLTVRVATQLDDGAAGHRAKGVVGKDNFEAAARPSGLGDKHPVAERTECGGE